MPYAEIFGSGKAFESQLITIAGIAIGIVFWYLLLERVKLFDKLKRYVIPLVFWIVIGTMDITITTRCAYIDASCEGNLLSRFFFERFTSYGGTIASFLWISLWMTIVTLLLRVAQENNLKGKIADIIIWTIFSGLALGHLIGFLTWVKI